MAFFLYSVEAFPGPGRPAENVQVLGTQIIVPAKTWMKLQKSYEEPLRRSDWKDESGTRSNHFTDELVPLLEEKYGFRGLVIMEGDQPGSAMAHALETKAAAKNKAWRETVVQDFLSSRRIAESGQPGGRFLPNDYEEECFRELGLVVPNTADAMRLSQQVPQVTVILSPEAINAAAAQSGSAKPATAIPAVKSVAVAELETESPRRAPGEPLR
jgi:hypothetical protein